MKKSIAAVASFAFLFFTGCASRLALRPTASEHASVSDRPSNASELAFVEYGIAPDGTHEGEIRSAMKTLLKDPESTPFRFTAPERGWFPRYVFEEDVPVKSRREEREFGWKVHFFVSAMNGDGAYTPEKPYEAFFQGGRLRGILQKLKVTDAQGNPTWGLLVAVPRAE